MASRLGDSKMRLRTNYPVMFSDVLLTQRIEGCLDSNSPSFMEKFMPQYDISGTPVFPSTDGPPYRGLDDVRGAQRAKYFIRYMNPMENLQTYHLTTTVKSRKHTHENSSEEPFKSRGTQTDQREMETQTDPYSPQYSLPNPDDYPKVLALVKMTWGKGLPATLDDIVTIERALTRRLLELSDRGQSADFAFGKRVKLMEELEAQKWKDREKELEKIKMLKMDIISKQLQEMKSRMSHEQTQRLEKMFETRKKMNAMKLQSIKMQYLMQLRKLERKHRWGKKTFKRDIILDYVDMESQIYAPLVRNGPNIDQLNSAPDYQFTVHRDYETLTYLTDMESFANEHLNFDLKKFALDVNKIKPNRATQIVEKQLQDCFETFNDVCRPKAEAMEDEMLNSMIMKSVRRLSTPENEMVCTEEEEDEEAVVLLQTLIRGRAVQSILRQEAQNSMETILQMKAVYETDPFGALQPIAEKVALRQQQYERDVSLSQENEVKELTEQVEGEILAHMMTFLEKEMTRLLDERKIHALILLAERERRMLEASEAGKRQKEEECQRTNDEIWRQVVGVHQQTVDMYLEDIYLESISRSADEGGRKYVQELARTVNEAAYVMERNIKDFDKDEIAADLVHSFLFPQVKRENVQRQMADLHGRYYTVATQVVTAVLNSKGVVHEVLSTIASELTNRLEIGTQSVNASYCAVQQIIQQAVRKVMEKEFEPELAELKKGGVRKESEKKKESIVPKKKEKKSKKGRKDKAVKEKGTQENTSASEKVLQQSDTSIKPSSKNLATDDEEALKSESDKMLQASVVKDSSSAVTLRKDGDDPSTSSFAATDVEPKRVSTPKEEKDIIEEAMQSGWDMPIAVPYGFDELIGLKSMEVNAVEQVGVEMAELGESVVKVYDASCSAVQDIMHDVEKCLIPSEDESDIELDDQDDDE